jgi:hypothetical protein
MIEKTIDIYDATDRNFPEVISIFESIAEKHDVKNGQYIQDKNKINEIIVDNCHHGIAICKLNIALNEEFESL